MIEHVGGKERYDDLMNTIEKIFGSEIKSKVEKRLNEDVLEIHSSRANCQVIVRNASGLDIEIVSEITIANILNLFDKDKRNGILYEAIKLSDSNEIGGLRRDEDTQTEQ